MKKLSLALLFASVQIAQAYVLNDFTNAVQAAKANKSDANIRKVLEILDDLTKKRNISSAQVQRLQELGLGEYANISNRLETYNLRRGTAAQAGQISAQQQELLNKQIDALRLKTEVERLRSDFLGAVGNLRRFKNEVAETLEQNALLSQAEFAKFQQEKKAEIDQLKADLQEAQQAANALLQNPNVDQATKDQIQNLQKQVNVRVAENIEQSKKLAELYEAIKQLRAEKEAAAQDVQTAQATITSIEQEFKTVKSEYSKAINQIAALEKQTKDADDKTGLADLKKQLDAQKAAYEKTLSDLKGQLDRANQELTAARSGAELQSAANKITLLEMQLVALRNQIGELQENLNNAKKFKSPDAAKDIVAQKIKEFIDQGSDFSALSKKMSEITGKVGYLPAAQTLANENNGIIGQLRKLYDDVTKEVSPFEQLKKINEFEALRDTFNANIEAIQKLDVQVRALLEDKIVENQLYKESITSLIFSDKALVALKENVMKKIGDLEATVKKLANAPITAKEYKSIVDDFDYIKENTRSLRSFDEALLVIDQAKKLFKSIDDFGKLLPGLFTRSPLSLQSQKGVDNLIKERADIKPQIDALEQLVNSQKGKPNPVLGDINTKIRDAFKALIRLADFYDIVAENVAVEKAQQLTKAPLALPAPETKPEVKPGNGGAKTPEQKLLDQYRASIVDAASATKAIVDLSNRDLEAEGEEDLVKNTLKKQIATEANIVRQVLAEKAEAGNKIELNQVAENALKGL